MSRERELKARTGYDWRWLHETRCCPVIRTNVLQGGLLLLHLSSAGNSSRWRAATEKRNSSILAHGVSPIGREGFEQMKQIAAGFLGFDLEREAHPIPPLEVRWFESAG